MLVGHNMKVPEIKETKLLLININFSSLKCCLLAIAQLNNQKLTF